MSEEEIEFWNVVSAHPRESLSHFTIVDPDNWVLVGVGERPAVLQSSSCRWNGPYEFGCDGHSYHVYVRAARYRTARRVLLEDLGAVRSPRKGSRIFFVAIAMLAVVILALICMPFLFRAEVSPQSPMRADGGIPDRKTMITEEAQGDQNTLSISDNAEGLMEELNSVERQESTRIPLTSQNHATQPKHLERSKFDQKRMNVVRDAFDEYSKGRNWLTTGSFSRLVHRGVHLADMGIGIVKIERGDKNCLFKMRASAEATEALCAGLFPHEIVVTQSVETCARSVSERRNWSATLNGAFQLLGSRWSGPDGHEYYVHVSARLADE